MVLAKVLVKVVAHDNGIWIDFDAVEIRQIDFFTENTAVSEQPLSFPGIDKRNKVVIAAVEVVGITNGGVSVDAEVSAVVVDAELADLLAIHLSMKPLVSVRS